jgi:hypothetical protein
VLMGHRDPLVLTVPKAPRDCLVLTALTEPKARRESRESKAFRESRESRAQQERTAQRVHKAPKAPLEGMF